MELSKVMHTFFMRKPQLPPNSYSLKPPMQDAERESEAAWYMVTNVVDVIIMTWAVRHEGAR